MNMSSVARTEWPGGSFRAYMVSRGKCKIGAVDDFWTFCHQIQEKIYVGDLGSFHLDLFQISLQHSVSTCKSLRRFLFLQ